MNECTIKSWTLDAHILRVCFLCSLLHVLYLESSLQHRTQSRSVGENCFRRLCLRARAPNKRWQSKNYALSPCGDKDNEDDFSCAQKSPAVLAASLSHISPVYFPLLRVNYFRQRGETSTYPLEEISSRPRPCPRCHSAVRVTDSRVNSSARPATWEVAKANIAKQITIEELRTPRSVAVTAGIADRLRSRGASARIEDRRAARPKLPSARDRICVCAFANASDDSDRTKL